MAGSTSSLKEPIRGSFEQGGCLAGSPGKAVRGEEWGVAFLPIEQHMQSHGGKGHLALGVRRKTGMAKCKCAGKESGRCPGTRLLSTWAPYVLTQL